MIYPTTVEKLASLAERNEDDPKFAAIMWERFDGLLPNPEGALLARRLAGSGEPAAATDLSPAARAFRDAALSLEEDPLRALTFAREAIDLFQSEFDYVNAARARLMAAWILAFTGDPKAAST